MTATASIAADPLDGDALFADVCRYESFGSHRFGSAGAEQTFDWLGAQLHRAGLAVSSQPFTMPRQYDLEHASLSMDGQSVCVMPQYWLAPQHEKCSMHAPIVTTGDVRGAFVHLSMPYEGTSYLTDTHRMTLQAAFARRPAAVLLMIDHPSDEIFVHNVDQHQAPWPVPVVLVAAKHRAVLERALATGAPATLTIVGTHRQQAVGRNIIGHLDRGTGPAVVVSTPVTSWFTSTCERGPGIAAFLALARIARERLAGVDLTFVGTAGHEIGHGGMQNFISGNAPPAGQVGAWLHLGSSLACHAWSRNAAGDLAKDGRRETAQLLINRSHSLDAPVRRHLGRLGGVDLLGKDAAVGELREVFAAGYPNFFGVAGEHAFFHTPADTSAGTGPELLEPVVAAIAAALMEICAAGSTGQR